MYVSRFRFCSSKQVSTQFFNLHQRFGPSKWIQSRSYKKSSGPRQGKQNHQPVPVNPVETQSPRSLSTFLIPIAAFGGLASLFYINDQRRAIPKGEGDKSYFPNVKGPVIGGPFSLVDTEKRVVTEKDLHGNWVLLYFGYTFSPDVGPDQVKVMARAIDILESRENLKVLPVFVTLDPQRDNPSHLGAYLKEFDSRIVGLTGSVAAVRQMAQEYRVYFRKIGEEGEDYLVECSHNMYLMSPNTEVAKCFGVEYNADELAEAIAKEIKRAS